MQKEGGNLILTHPRIDNHLNKIGDKIVNQGIAVQYYIDRLAKINTSRDEKVFKREIVVITSEEIDEIIAEAMKEIKIKAQEQKISCEVLRKKQTCTDFQEYFSAFKMKAMIILRYDDSKKVNFLIKQLIYDCKCYDKKLGKLEDTLKYLTSKR